MPIEHVSVEGGSFDQCLAHLDIHDHGLGIGFRAVIDQVE
jgi:hypothetical protein